MSVITRFLFCTGIALAAGLSQQETNGYDGLSLMLFIWTYFRTSQWTRLTDYALKHAGIRSGEH